MSITAITELQWFSKHRYLHRSFRSGVSLHSDTMYSEENLNILPRWVVKHATAEVRNGFWTPPLTPRQAYRLAQKQIEAQFQLPALVSLTDHDDIRAGTLLQVLDRFRNAPVSTEMDGPVRPHILFISGFTICGRLGRKPLWKSSPISRLGPRSWFAERCGRRSPRFRSKCNSQLVTRDDTPGIRGGRRARRFSHVVFMPQYRQSRKLRILHTVIDVLRDYPDNVEGRRTWSDRVFYRDPHTRVPAPFATIPGSAVARVVGHFVNAMRLVDRRRPPAILTSA